MEVIYPRCAALDVHKKSVVAHAITPGQRETLTFGTMTKDLLEFKKWLHYRKVTHVAMESAGVYWKPIYNLLEDTFTLLVVNARSQIDLHYDNVQIEMQNIFKCLNIAS